MPEFFATPDAWRRWLLRHHAKKSAVWVGFWKRGNGNKSITWPDAKAWKWFSAPIPSYRRIAQHWVVSAKQEATRLRRFEQLLACSASGENVKPLRRP